MLSIDFLSFSEGWYKEPEDAYIYILRHLDNSPLYVGMTRDAIWNRWFYGLRAHIITNYYGEWFGGSPAGQYIINHIPESNDYTIELWTPEECIEFAQDYIQTSYMKNYKHWDIESAEEAMIKKLQPLLNIMHNS